jgi:DNA-binding MurR/RpiR family transcriptional regulator
LTAEELSVAELVRSAMETLSPAERQVGRALLADYPRAGLRTVAGLAEQAGVSGPSVLRFAQRLGFDGFPALQDQLRDELSTHGGGPLGRLVDAPAPDSATDPVVRTAAYLAENAARSIGRIPPLEFDSTVRLLADPAKRVLVSGGQYSGIVAARRADLLHRVRSQGILLADPWRQDLGTVLDAKRGDVCVVVDIRRYQQDTVDLAAHFRARRASVILITDEWLSPAAQHAHVVLPVGTRSPSPFDSLTGAIVLVESLVTATLPSIGTKAHERLRAWEQLSRADVTES